jgi:hypothetical protein
MINLYVYRNFYPALLINPCKWKDT